MKGESFEIDTEFTADKDKITSPAWREGLEEAESRVQG